MYLLLISKNTVLCGLIVLPSRSHLRKLVSKNKTKLSLQMDIGGIWRWGFGEGAEVRKGQRGGLPAPHDGVRGFL